MTTDLSHISDPGHFQSQVIITDPSHTDSSHNDRRPGHNNKPGHDLI